MKSVLSLVAVALSASSSSAFVPPAAAPMRAAPLSMAKPTMTPELEAAIADVRDAASAFGEETQHFANGALFDRFTILVLHRGGILW